MHARAKVAAVAFGATLSLAGCSLAASITTSNEYDPSDGTGATVGDISSENFLLITSGKGEPAALIGTLYNAGADAESVVITVGSDSETVTVPAMGSLTLGLGEGQEAFVTTSPVLPGLLAEVSIEPAGQAPAEKPLPVMDGTLPEYDAVLTQLAGYEG